VFAAFAQKTVRLRCSGLSLCAVQLFLSLSLSFSFSLSLSLSLSPSLFLFLFIYLCLSLSVRPSVRASPREPREFLSESQTSAVDVIGGLLINQ